MERDSDGDRDRETERDGDRQTETDRQRPTGTHRFRASPRWGSGRPCGGVGIELETHNREQSSGR